jgi:S-adenosylmethionine uptake transporter
MTRNIILSSCAIIFAGIFFVINDAIINFLSSINIQFYHFIFYGAPAFISFPIYLIFSGQFKDKMRSTNYWIPLIRGVLFAPMPLFTFIALKNITLPEYTTLNMSSPLIAILLAIFFLKEKLNTYIIISLFFGFIGVLFVIQPGFESFNMYFLLVLLSALLITLTTTIVNKYNTVTSSIGYFVYGGIFTHLISWILFILNPLTINLKIFLLITFASILINLAIFLSIFAFKISQKYYASVFCLVYLQIVWSTLIGIIFFNEYLNFIAYLGAFMIIISGIISIPAQKKQLSE